MKPFGVRLAAGAVTILLGAIMAAQAQKDHQDDLQTSWNPLNNIQRQADGDAPAPIGLGQWNQTDDDGEKPPASPFADVPGAIQLVQHTEAAIGDVAGDVANALALPTTFAPPSDASNESTANAMAMPAMTFPGDAPGQEPAGDAQATDGLNLPPSQSLAMPAAGQDSADAMPPSGQPSNFLRGGVSDQETQPIATDAAQPANMTPNNFMGGFGEQSQDNIAANQNDNGAASQMLRAVAMPDNSAADQAAALAAERDAIQREQALAAEQELRQQQAREEQELQRRADAMLAREELAREQEIQAQQIRQRQAAPQPNQFAANNGPTNNGFGQPLPSQRRSVEMNGFDNQPQPSAPPLPRGQYDGGQYANGQFDNRPSNFQNNGRRDTSSRIGMGQTTLPALPAAHRLAGQSTGSLAQPGDRRLEGVQAPSVVIHKRAPSEVKVGKPASFVIQVQNVGSAEALDVQVHDQVPAGMQFKGATPQAQAGNNGQLVWQLGSLAAGEERTLTMELVPVEEGELGSVARVTFEAAASVRTMSTRPELKIVQKAPPTVLVGQQLEIEVEVSNPGTGDATGVMLQEDVPENLEHPRGRELDNLIGTLRPGEVRRQMLRLRAVAPGMVRNTVFLRGDDGMETSHSVDVQVVAPQLQVALVGPGRRFLERQAVYSLDIANSGTAQATNVRITAFLDRGFTFVSTGNAGQYDPSRHAVYWQLDNLPVGANDSVPLTLLPVQEGARSIQLEAKADLGVIAKNEQRVDVESLAELTFSVADSADPIEVGTETTYEIKVVNQGSRPDSNVSVKVQLPPGLELLGAEDAETDGRGLVAFRPRAHLGANSELVYRIKARGIKDGRHKIQAMVVSDQSSQPVTKEESTMVYDDRQPAVARGQRGQNRTQPSGQQFR
ncbi:hypothetical protein [Stieleria marina]|uniref:Large cysteine-rich periplasmic protein OmcB n=1 Tax=Stieleria marina TaxID=1930275 RepID=A0A517NZA3_9BACT|nr:Large cysteine-rich periplasmic protein OmcB precursor [Planctomycetes bacterium K23_9]